MAAAAPERLAHLALRSDWAAALAAGRYEVSTRGMSVAEVGFVHASTRAQLPGVRERFYADLDPAELVVLVIDVAAAGVPLRWDPVPGGELFPHLYGPLPVQAVVAVLPVTDAGLPDLAGHDVVAAGPAGPAGPAGQ